MPLTHGMPFSVVIDGFRLVTAPRTSHATYIADLVECLSTLGAIKRVYLLLPRAPVNDPSCSKLIKLNKVEAVWQATKSYPERTFRSQIYWVQRVIPQLIQTIKDSVDCYIAPYHHPPILLPKKIRVVTVIHDVCGIKSSAGYYKTKKGFYQHLFMFALTAVRSDVIVPISNYTKREFSCSFPFLRSRVSEVVYNCLKCDTVDGTLVEKTLEKYRFRRENYFLAFGLPGLRKGLDLVLKAYSAYRAGGGQCALVLIVPADCRNIVGREVIANGISEPLMLSDIDIRERDALYRAAVALLFPSRCEGFGYPVIEAMRQGCPPIAWHDSPAAEILGHGFPLLESLDSEEILKHMTRYEHLEADERLALQERLIARSLAFEAENFGHQFLGAIRGPS